MNFKHLRMKRFSTTLLLIALVLSGWAQKPKTVTVEARGTSYVFDNITPDQATERALYAAKIEALKQANVPENVYSVTLVNIENSGNEFSEISSELGKISIDGLVLVKKKTVNKFVHEDNNPIEIIVDITAEVMVEKQTEDKTFTLKIGGLDKTTYRENENLTFTILPYKDCYVRVFWFNNSLKGTGDILFPYRDANKDAMFYADKLYPFPPTDPNFLVSQEFEYTITKESNEPYDKVILLIVALKEKIPFTQEVTYDNVIKWLFTIDKSERCEFWYPVMIIK